MIHVNRNRVAAPPELEDIWSRERERAREFFQTEAGSSGQERFQFSAYRHPEVKQALRELFHGKCAFCESILVLPSESIELFRPRQNTVNLHGEHFPLHYWWLSGEWSNLYLACQVCNSTKRNRFPIRGSRCEPEATGKALDEERPLLLDPCAQVDNPEEHLVYTDDGLVTSDTEPGRITIELFDLNREPLRDARREVSVRLNRWLEVLASLPPSEAPRLWSRIEPMLSDRAEFAGMCRQVVRRFSEEASLDELGIPGRSPRRPTRGPSRGGPKHLGPGRGGPKRGEPSRRTFEESLSGEHASGERDDRRRGLGGPPVSFEAPVDRGPVYLDGEEEPDIFAHTRFVPLDEQAKIAEDFSVAQAVQQSYSLDQKSGETAPGAKESYYERSRTVERVVLHNFRGIEHLDIELPRREGPWTVLLGENGAGKSSVLQAVALALVGRRYRESLDLDARDFVRRGSDGIGFVRVFLSGMNEPIQLDFHQDSEAFEGAQEPKVLLLAYGATRLLPRPRASPHQADGSYGTDFARAHNLFDPFQPLEDAQRWLLGLEAAEFDNLKPSFKALLNLGDEDDLRQNHAEERIDVQLFGTEVSLTQLSDGYQTVVALTAEVMSILLDRWSDMAVAEGIVLLDELGSHLHPKWKMQIVSSLRKAFPAVQFLATTHDPLCLRGLEDGDVVVLRRNSRQQIVQVRDLPPVKALRVDQLLTSEHFGMSSTQDPESARLLEEYYELLALDQRSDEQSERLRDLQRDLRSFHLLGQTRRERLMLTAIDLYLAREAAALGVDEIEDPKLALDRQLQRILDVT